MGGPKRVGWVRKRAVNRMCVMQTMSSLGSISLHAAEVICALTVFPNYPEYMSM